VSTQEEEEILSRGSKKSEKLRQQLMSEMPVELLGKHLFARETGYLSSNQAKLQESLDKARQHKERLLEFDKNRFVFVVDRLVGSSLFLSVFCYTYFMLSFVITFLPNRPFLTFNLDHL